MWVQFAVTLPTQRRLLRIDYFNEVLEVAELELAFLLAAVVASQMVNVAMNLADFILPGGLFVLLFIPISLYMKTINILSNQQCIPVRVDYFANYRVQCKVPFVRL